MPVGGGGVGIPAGETLLLLLPPNDAKLMDAPAIFLFFRGAPIFFEAELCCPSASVPLEGAWLASPAELSTSISGPLLPIDCIAMPCVGMLFIHGARRGADARGPVSSELILWALLRTGCEKGFPAPTFVVPSFLSTLSTSAALRFWSSTATKEVHLPATW